MISGWRACHYMRVNDRPSMPEQQSAVGGRVRGMDVGRELKGPAGPLRQLDPSHIGLALGDA